MFYEKSSFIWTPDRGRMTFVFILCLRYVDELSRQYIIFCPRCCWAEEKTLLFFVENANFFLLYLRFVAVSRRIFHFCLPCVELSEHFFLLGPRFVGLGQKLSLFLFACILLSLVDKLAIFASASLSLADDIFFAAYVWLSSADKLKL